LDNRTPMFQLAEVYQFSALRTTTNRAAGLVCYVVVTTGAGQRACRVLTDAPGELGC
jgi:hypothetical protein